MTIFRHEMRRGALSLVLWTVSIAFLLAVCVLLFPEMKGEMSGDMFASMGSFTQAFGMDRLDFGTLLGFYGVECGNILSLGGACFAAIAAIGLLSKEEKEHTAEFLLTPPIGRASVVGQKLAALLVQILLLNVFAFAIGMASIVMIGEEIAWRKLLILHGAYLLMQVELAGICFGISAFLRRGGPMIGLGLAMGMYFLNLIANLSDQAKWLKALTPFGYAESADILTSGTLNGGYVAVGAALCLAGLAAAFWHYGRKDIA